LIACLALLAALAVTASAGAATERTDAPWMWTPGACKSTLVHTGVQTADGRIFSVAQAYCVGWGGTATCTWSNDSWQMAEAQHEKGCGAP